MKGYLRGGKAPAYAHFDYDSPDNQIVITAQVLRSITSYDINLLLSDKGGYDFISLLSADAKGSNFTKLTSSEKTKLQNYANFRGGVIMRLFCRAVCTAWLRRFCPPMNGFLMELRIPSFVLVCSAYGSYSRDDGLNAVEGMNAQELLRRFEHRFRMYRGV